MSVAEQAEPAARLQFSQRQCSKLSCKTRSREPWPAFAKLTKQDAQAIAAYLKSLPPVSSKVPGPFGPGETPTSFVMKIVPPQKQGADSR